VPIISTDKNKAIYKKLPEHDQSNIPLPASSTESDKMADEKGKGQNKTELELEDLQPMQKQLVEPRRRERLHQKAQQGGYIEELDESALGVVLDYNFCSVAFEINEDELPVHSVNYLIQESGKNNTYISDTAQNNNKNEKNEGKSDSIGEEPILNEPYTYDNAIKAPDAD
jgi:hypothetical protein